jgi:hypothetical protein
MAYMPHVIGVFKKAVSTENNAYKYKCGCGCYSRTVVKRISQEQRLKA